MTRATTARATTEGQASIDVSGFSTLLSTMPFAPRQANAKGLIPVLMRSAGHLLYIVGATAEERHVLSPEELQVELNHAAEHLDASALVTATTLSTAAKNNILAYCTAVGHAKDSAAHWPEADRARLLRDLANRAAGLGAFLDREFIGLADSDPGSSL